MLCIVPIPLMGLLFGGMSAIGAVEFLRACHVPKNKGFYLLCTLSAIAIPSGYGMWDRGLTLLSASLTMVLILFLITIFHYKTPEKSIPVETLMLCFFAGVVIPMLLGSVVSLRERFGVFAVILPVVIAFSSDTGAYFVGVLLGKHRNITAVSPNKSLEGFLGGMFFCMLITVCYGILLEKYTPIVSVSLAHLALYGFVGGFMTIIGDLSFSLVKRQKGIKDYGNFIVGHGGILDRFDSLTFVAPLVLLLLEIIPAF